MTPQQRLDVAIHRGSAAGVKAAIKAGADVNFRPRPSYFLPPLCKAITQTSPRIVKILLDAGADPKKGTEKCRPLHLAAEARAWNEAFCAMLIAAGAKVNAKDNLGATPLHYAAWTHQSGAARLLVNMGAKIDARDESGRTPLFCALASIDNARGCIVDTIDFLLKAGADPDAKSMLGISPRGMAATIDSSVPIAHIIMKLFNKYKK